MDFVLPPATAPVLAEEPASKHRKTPCGPVNRPLIFVRMKAIGLVVLICSTPSARAATPPTFHKDVEPILQSHCQGCHHPGDIGPMPLQTYEQSRPWAKAIRSAVLRKKMPPWFADPSHGKFLN